MPVTAAQDIINIVRHEYSLTQIVRYILIQRLHCDISYWSFEYFKGSA